MSELNGNLADFPLRDVIQLLSAGAKTGILVVETRDLRGSVFFDDGLLTFATTRAGAADARGSDRRDPMAQEDAKDLIVGVVVRLLRQDGGSFLFENGITPVHPTDGAYPAADVIEGAEELLGSWEQIEKSIGSVRAPHRLVREPDENELILSPSDWRVLSGVAEAGSVVEVSVALAMPEFDVAVAMASLCERGLIEPRSDGEPAFITESTYERQITPTVDTEFEYYVNSHGTALREPVIPRLSEPVLEDVEEPIEEPAAESEVFLDLTKVEEADVVASAPEPIPSLQARRNNTDEAPSSELARRWRDLRAAPRD